MNQIPLQTRVVAAGLLLLTAASLGGYYATSGFHVSFEDLYLAIVLSIVIVIAEKFKIDFPHPSFNLTVSVGAVLALAAALTFDPLLAALTYICASTIGDLWDRLLPIKIVVNACSLGLATFFGSVVYRYFADESHLPLHDIQNMSSVVLASVVFSLINTGSLAIAVAPVVKQSPITLWKSNFSFMYILVSLPALGSLIPVIARQHPLALAVIFVPLMASHLSQRTLRQVQAETQATMESLADALEVRDRYTHNHSVRVTQYTEMILDELPELPAGTRKQIIDAARIHDLGKIGIRDASLLKPGKLTDEEFKEMQSHAAIGAELVGKLGIYRPSIGVVRHHHERWDGRGYPDRIAGEQIPLGARIIAVADSFDAMTSDRPYRKGMTLDEGLAEVARCSGSQFDPHLAALFLRAWERKRAAESVPAPAVFEPLSTNGHYPPPPSPSEAPDPAVTATAAD